MTATVSARRSRELLRGDRALEMLAVILLGIATVGSAWCGFQASSWNGKQGDLARAASDERVEANRLFSLATQALAYDAGLIADYARAYRTGDEEAKEFYRRSLVRPEFLPVLDEWEATADAGRYPGNLFTDEEYLTSEFGPYQEASERSEALSLESEEAGRNSDAYVLTTLLLASALFFAGVTSSFRYRSVRLLLLAAAVVALAVAAARIVDVPMA